MTCVLLSLDHNIDLIIWYHDLARKVMKSAITHKLLYGTQCTVSDMKMNLTMILLAYSMQLKQTSHPPLF